MALDSGVAYLPTGIGLIIRNSHFKAACRRRLLWAKSHKRANLFAYGNAVLLCAAETTALIAWTRTSGSSIGMPSPLLGAIMALLLCLHGHLSCCRSREPGLIAKGYVNSIPTDPMTANNRTWRVALEDRSRLRTATSLAYSTYIAARIA